MKILLFTHEADIDGLGCAVLAHLSYKNVKTILTDPVLLPDIINNMIIDKSIYNYDKIYITDMWLRDDVLTKIANDNILSKRVLLFDHHESAIHDNLNRYSFTSIIIKLNNRLTCGTELFYNYLKDTNNIKPTKAIDRFVELTRRHDTWEWRTIYNDEDAINLSRLSTSLGKNLYINTLIDKLKDSNEFNFNNLELTLIESLKEKQKEDVKHFTRFIYYKNINQKKLAILFIPYVLRNEISEELRNMNIDADIAMLVSFDNHSISYRQLKKDVNVLEIAKLFGGMGHIATAGSTIFLDEIEKVIDILTTKR